MKTVTYHYGIYKNYNELKNGKMTKIAQLTDNIDCLSCEILADPGVESFMEDNQQRAIINAEMKARRDKCDLLEVNLNHYKTIKL